MLAPGRPNSLSRSAGLQKRRSTMRSSSPGMYSPSSLMQCSPKRSRSVSQLPSASSSGAWKMLALRMCFPGGARVGSATVGKRPQYIGPRDQRPYFASSNARSWYSMLGAIRNWHPEHSCSMPFGDAANRGRASSARANLKAEPFLGRFLTLARNFASRCRESTRSRKVVQGPRFETTAAASISSPSSRTTPLAPLLVGENPGDACSGADLSARRLDGLAHGAHDAAHAPEREARGSPQHLPARVVGGGDGGGSEGHRAHHQPDGGARREGAEPVGHHPEHRDHRLEVLRLEVLVQQVDDRAEVDLGKGLLVLGGGEPRGELGQRRWRFEEGYPEAFRKAIEELEEGCVALDVLLREAPDLLRHPFGLAPRDEGPTVREGEHQRRVRSGEREPEALELEVADDLGLERTGRVGDRGPIAGKVLVLRAGPAHDVALLEHQHVDSGPGEVGRAGQTVVPAADHHDFVSVHAGKGSLHSPFSRPVPVPKEPPTPRTRTTGSITFIHGSPGARARGRRRCFPCRSGAVRGSA